MGFVRRVIPLAAIGIALMASAASSQTAAERAVRAASDRWQRDIAAGNVDAITALHTPDAVVMFANSPVATGAAIRGLWGDMVKLPDLTLHWIPTKIQIVSPTVATEYGTYTDSYNGPQGKISDAGSYLTVWKKINGQWRVAYDVPVSSVPLPQATAAPMDAADTRMSPNNGLVWSDLNVPGFDPGAKIAVLHGNPAAKGDYTLRLQFPAGYRFPVHWHPNGEHLTVMSGTFQLAMGNTANSSALQNFGPGDFMYLPARHAHFGGAQGVTVIQLHGEGPFTINLGPGQ